jgi:hypothetical protein
VSARELGRWLGSAQSGKRGKGKRATRGERRVWARAVGLRRKIRPGWDNGPKPKGRGISFLVFLFQIFKAIFQKILNPLLNLIQTTQYKNSDTTT